jgi:hypothetical protein
MIVAATYDNAVGLVAGVLVIALFVAVLIAPERF